jgi:hypothetical protein
MKTLFNTVMGRPIRTVVNTQLNSTWNANPVFYLMILFTAFVFTACKKIVADKPQATAEK